MQDLHNVIDHRHVISPQSVADNTALVGTIIDHADHDSVEYLIQIGSVGDADATFTVLLEDGDNSSLTDNAAVADAQLLGTEAGASFIFDDDNQVRKLGYRGAKRYSRLTITPALNASAALIGASVILGHPRKEQTSQE